jgi:hypothetical protein
VTGAGNLTEISCVCSDCAHIVLTGRVGVFGTERDRREYLARLMGVGGPKGIHAAWAFDTSDRPGNAEAGWFYCAACGGRVFGGRIAVSQTDKAGAL